MKSSKEELLRTVVEKSRKLDSIDFVSEIESKGLGFRFEQNRDGTWDFDFDLPDDVDRDAFLLTFRLFVQKNDAVSFNQLKEWAEQGVFSREWNERIFGICEKYEAFMGSYPSNIKDLFGARPTNREILRVVLYGDLAHTSSNKRDLFLHWTRDEIRRLVLMQNFANIIVQVNRLIRAVSEVSEKELGKFNLVN